MNFLVWAIGLTIAAFLLVVFRGAPYVPTRRAQVEQALDMLDIPRGGTIVDLGSGDGVFLGAAARRGYQVIGYEINPILCVVSYLHCWRYRERVSVRWRDFWLTPLPAETDAVFVFLAGPFVRRLDKKLRRDQHKVPLSVISYGFLIPEAGKPLRSEHALHLYHYE